MCVCLCVTDAFLASQYSDIVVHTQLCQEWICSVFGTLHLNCQGFVEIWGKVLYLNVAN